MNSSVVAAIAGDRDAAERVELTLPESGVCGGAGLFDEADALFGRRTDVHDSHDRYATRGIDYLLQRLEGFSGLAILESNERDTIEATLGGRLDRQISFPLPRRDRSASGKP